ncbi:MAG: rod shape determining protein RodA, partial [bacterium]
MFDRRLLENFDWFILFLVSLISILGVITIKSASQGYPNEILYYQKQLIWFGLGLVVMISMTLVDYRTIGRFSLFFHGIVILLLILVLMYGTGGPGSKVSRWLKVGSIFIQPSEFAKFSLILYLSHYFNDSRRIGDIGFKELLWPLFVTVVPFLLILKQPDLGTAGLLFFIFIPIIFLAGIQLRLIGIAALLGTLLLPIGWFFVLKPYQQDRILTVLSPERDPLGKGYHIIQSKIAVGSGELLGKGLGKGTQAELNFLPARHTDFIFSIFAEEWGFTGATALIGLYFILIIWSLRFIGKTKDRSGSILTLGVTSIIAAH